MAVFSTVIPLLLLFPSVSSPYANGNLVLDIECSFVVLNMATCLSFVTNGSQVDKPDALCCSGLKKVLDTKAECLCVGLKKSASMGIKVNFTVMTQSHHLHFFPQPHHLHLLSTISTFFATISIFYNSQIKKERERKRERRRR
ncbi:hypothetical protein F2Q68_00001457 [Brassica cretica]|uniref:Bifunctional inhibitor/plant lipid transfer protein/seed storage helical domain-containing protein n=1 Tax=Brassica cretica TaxID=69181 RepID=A0A8S9JDR4_BRACR|nr:hypothetical protein F2Q68_00001457 [Brassica cretica]